MVHLSVCAVDRCLNNELTHPGKKFFKFPSDKKLCRKWLQNCNIRDVTPKEANSTKFNLKVCGDHFENNCFPPTSKNRLRRDIEVIPTIFDNVTDPVTFQSREKGDHSYSIGIDLPPKTSLDEDPAEFFECVLDPRELLVKTDRFPLSYNFDAKPKYYDSKSMAAVLLNISPDAKVFQVKDLCRLCLDTVGYDFINIFDSSREAREVRQMCTTVLPRELNFNVLDGIPQCICRNCIQDLKKCYKIVTHILQADSYLRMVAKHSLYIQDDLDLEERLFKTDEEERLAQVIPSDALVVPLPVIKSVPDIKSDSDTLSAVGSDIEQEVLNTEIDNDESNMSLIEELPDIHWDENQSNLDLDINETKTNLPEILKDKITYDCGICHEGFPSFSLLYEHRNKQHGNIKFKCDQCVDILGFENKKDFDVHMTENHKVECKYCQKIFFFESQLQKHIAHRHEKVHKCRFCEKEFKYAKTRIKHETFNHSKATDVCWVCGKLVKHLSLHLRTHDMNRTYTCRLCDKMFKTPGSRNFHVKDVHFPEKFKKIVCDKCDERFAGEKLLQYHKELKHTLPGSVNYTCDKCGGGFLTIFSYESHKRKLAKKGVCGPTCHKEILRNDPESIMRRKQKILYKNKICDVCGRAFFLKKTLNKHRSYHLLNCDKEVLDKLLNEPEYHKCNDCERKFPSKLMLMKHRGTVHTKETKPFECEFCGKKFRMSLGLIVHYRRHTGYKEKCRTFNTFFTCEKCQRRFTAKSFYERHTLVCNGKAKHSTCWSCNKTFGNISGLKHHNKRHHREQQHESDKAEELCFPCWICDKAFATKKGLANHITVKHGKQTEEQHEIDEVAKLESYVQIPKECGDYVTIDLRKAKHSTCWSCNKTFGNISGLKHHNKRHHREQQHESDKAEELCFPCWICDKAFATKKGLANHITVKHGKQTEEQHEIDEVAKLESYVQIPKECRDYVTIDLSGYTFITSEQD